MTVGSAKDVLLDLSEADRDALFGSCFGLIQLVKVDVADGLARVTVGVLGKAILNDVAQALPASGRVAVRQPV